MAETTSTTQQSGREFLAKSDFVPIWDAEGNELPPVLKHWTADQLPLGATKKKPAAKSETD
jgi:hypothetical protein